MSDPVRPIADQRRLLLATIRSAAYWRRDKADEFDENAAARKANLRAKAALLHLANFVEELPDDDLDLHLHALHRLDEHDGTLRLTPDGIALLSRFGMSKDAWQSSTPTENQMRNVLRRVDGVEAKERRARKERAEAGYGDD
jgi:hypothetical protein